MSNRGMKTEQAIALAGSRRKLASLLGVTRQAIQQYREFLPPERETMLASKKPEWFALESNAVNQGVSAQKSP